MHSCKYRIGLTGTLDGMQCHQLQLEGLFGPVEKVIRTDELQKKGYLSDLKINVLVCKHEYVEFENYQEEIEYIITHPKRNKIIVNLASDLSGNTLVLFNYIERHGDVLRDMLNSKKGNKKLFYIHNYRCRFFY